MVDVPQIFIGSSREGLELAQAIQHSLKGSAECTVWNQGAFQLGKATLENLYNFLESFDFAVFVLTPDDTLDIRGKSGPSVRDNVIFELGLFIGGIGRDRVILVAPDDHGSFHLPSDLDGIVMAIFETDVAGRNPAIAVGPACFEIRSHMRKISEVGPVGAPRKKRSGFAGAMCFRKTSNAIEYLLITMTEQRRLFPKGRIGYKRTPIEAAKKYALDEGGVKGRFIDGTIRNIKYYKEAALQIHSLDVFLLEVTDASKPKQENRNPEWYPFEGALAEITSRRDYNTSYEIADLMEWAKKHIEKHFRR